MNLIFEKTKVECIFNFKAAISGGVRIPTIFLSADAHVTQPCWDEHCHIFLLTHGQKNYNLFL